MEHRTLQEAELPEAEVGIPVRRDTSLIVALDYIILFIYLFIYTYIDVYIYIYVYIHTCIHTHIHNIASDD